MGERYGRYETIRTIASGGMATVHLGRAVGEGGFERLVAIKVMHPHIAEDGDFRSMFLDEARLAARIRHPNVVGTIDVQTSDAGMFLVMDFVDGPSLHGLRRDFRRRKQRVPIEHTLRIFVDALSGLHAAHELTGVHDEPLQLVHRDVSPQNILVGKDGVTRITDFGVARAEARITSTQGGQLKGKLAYMPAEQVKNEKVDRRVDIYAAGVSLWEALVGRRMLKADNEAGLIHMILDGAQLSPREANPDVPESIDKVCMKALRVERDDRYDTAADFADALEEAAQQAGITISTSRKLAKFIQTLPPRLSERPSSMSTTPSSLSLADMAKHELLKLEAEEGPTRLVDSQISVVSSRVSSEVSSKADPFATTEPPGAPNTASAVIKSPDLPLQGRRSLWLVAGAAVAVLIVIGVVMTGGSSETASPAAIPPVEETAKAAAAVEESAEAPATAAPAASSAEPDEPESTPSAKPKPAAKPKPVVRPRPVAQPRPKGKPAHRGPGYKPREL
jgi:serine/threonine protein kinase